MRTLRSFFRVTPFALILLIMLIVTSGLSASANQVAARAASLETHHSNTVYHARPRTRNPEAEHIRQLVQSGQMAASVSVLDSLPPTTIVQFPLVPSGIKQKFPNAKGLVTIIRGSRNDSTADTVTIDVENMPPNVTFTIFFIELANKPFGHVQYVADVTTRGDGSGESVFHIISLVAFALDARSPGSSQDDTEGTTSGINLEHLGMWFSSLDDAVKVLQDDTLTGTIFDGGNPPLHAGPQAMTDGQTAPVF
jgi:hypothetical protein